MAEKSDNSAASKADLMKATTQAGAGAAPGGGIVSNVLNASEYVTDPKKRKKTLWGCLAGIGCCALPFFIGLAVGIAVITQLCQLYFAWWATPARLADKAYGEVRSWFTGDNTTLLTQFCGSPTGSLYGSVVGCNTLEVALSYMGKVRYVYAGGHNGNTSPRDNGIWWLDCSSFVSKVLQDLGIDMPIMPTGPMASRWDKGQDPNVKPVFETPIAYRTLTEEEVRANIRPGDIIIRNKSNTKPASGPNEHTGFIYSIDYEHKTFIWLDNSSDRNGKSEAIPAKGLQFRSRGWNDHTWNIYRVVSQGATASGGGP